MATLCHSHGHYGSLGRDRASPPPEGIAGAPKRFKDFELASRWPGFNPPLPRSSPRRAFPACAEETKGPHLPPRRAVASGWGGGRGVSVWEEGSASHSPFVTLHPHPGPVWPDLKYVSLGPLSLALSSFPARPVVPWCGAVVRCRAVPWQGCGEALGPRGRRRSVLCLRGRGEKAHVCPDHWLKLLPRID